MAEPYAQQPYGSTYLYQRLEHTGNLASEQQALTGEAPTRQLPALPSMYSTSSVALPSYASNLDSQEQDQVPASPALLEGTSPRSSSPKPVSSGKTFQCTGYDGCSMSFSRSEHLARHVRKHTGEKPFPCRCGKKFTRLDNLRQHASTIHADEVEANEELFTRLAAHMPRSGQRARKQNAQLKASTTSAAAVPSPKAIQTTFPSSQQPASATPTFRAPMSSDAHRFFPNSPLSASSSTFRIPPANASPVHTFRAAAYEGYASQPSPQAWSTQSQILEQSRPQPIHPPSPTRFSTNNQTTNFSPVPATGGGSHFRSYAGSNAVLEPTRVESSRAATGSSGSYLSNLSATDAYATNSPTGRSSPRPILPSLSSLIADAPAITFPTASFAKHRPNQRVPAPLQVLQSAAQLDKALLVAVELAMGSPASSNRESFEETDLRQSSSRSLSFSSDDSLESLGYSSVSPVSTAVPSPPALTVDSFTSSPVAAKVLPHCVHPGLRQQLI